MEEEKITITQREYNSLKYTESLYGDFVEFIKKNVPKMLEPIIKEEIEKFNKANTKEGSEISWAESLSYRIHCQGFFPSDDDGILWEDFGYRKLYQAISEKLEPLGFFDKNAIDEYDSMANENGKLEAIDQVFYDIVKPMYYEMSDELKNQIEGIYDSYEPEVDDD